MDLPRWSSKPQVDTYLFSSECPRVSRACEHQTQMPVKENIQAYRTAYLSAMAICIIQRFRELSDSWNLFYISLQILIFSVHICIHIYNIYLRANFWLSKFTVPAVIGNIHNLEFYIWFLSQTPLAKFYFKSVYKCVCMFNFGKAERLYNA